jgi:hypothetical protein
MVTKDVQRAEIDPDTARYNPVVNEVALSFTNTGTTAIALPAEAIAQRVLRHYRNTATGAVQVFNRGETPIETLVLTRLQPGAVWTYGLGFEFPDQILSGPGPWAVEICVSWDKAELNAAVFPVGSYDWAVAFEVCENTTIR